MALPLRRIAHANEVSEGVAPQPKSRVGTPLSGILVEELDVRYFAASASESLGLCQRRSCLSGAPVDDVQRTGTYTWPPNATNYAWGGFSTAVAQAEMLHRAGYPAFDWEQQAVKRGMTFIQESMTSSGSTPTDWIPWVVNYRYHTSFPAKTPTGWGRLMGWTDWTHTR